MAWPFRRDSYHAHRDSVACAALELVDGGARRQRTTGRARLKSSRGGFIRECDPAQDEASALRDRWLARSTIVGERSRDSPELMKPTRLILSVSAEIGAMLAFSGLRPTMRKLVNKKAEGGTKANGRVRLCDRGPGCRGLVSGQPAYRSDQEHGAAAE